MPSGNLGLPEGAWTLAQLVLEDLTFFGDGCLFLDVVGLCMGCCHRCGCLAAAGHVDMPSDLLLAHVLVLLGVVLLTTHRLL